MGPERQGPTTVLPPRLTSRAAAARASQECGWIEGVTRLVLTVRALPLELHHPKRCSEGVADGEGFTSGGSGERMRYNNGFTVDGTIPNVGGSYGPPS